MTKCLRTLCAVLCGAAIALFPVGAYSESVNPASNVIADSNATAETIIYRDSSNASTLHTLTVSNSITVPAGSIDTTKITGTFIASDLASDSVDSFKIASDSVWTGEIKDGQVALADLASNSVDSNKIIDGTIYSGDIADGQVAFADVGSNAVDSTKILDASVSLADLRTDSVDSNKIIDGTVYNAEIAAAAAIDSSKISGTWLAANIAANVLGTTKLLAVSGTVEDSYILCYTNDGGIGKCVDYDGGADTGKLCSCGPF